MSGWYRLALAIYVALFHLSGAWPFAGQLAVYAFYTLSGYLITLVLTTRYKANVKAFAINRLLRIYPTYWFCLALSAALVALLGAQATEFMPRLYLPEGLALWQNLFVFGLLENDVRLLPPAWSLNIELVWYILMGLGLSRWRTVTLVWFIFSWALLFWSQPADWADVYFTFTYPGAAFATGALFCHLQKFIPSPGVAVSWTALTTATVFPALPYLLAQLGVSYTQIVSSLVWLHLSPFFTLAAIFGFSSLEQKFGRGFWSSLAGDMSYPVFLLHWPIAAFIGVELLESDDRNHVLALSAIALCMVVSALMAVTYERSIKKLRTRIRPKQDL